MTIAAILKIALYAAIIFAVSGAMIGEAIKGKDRKEH